MQNLIKQEQFEIEVLEQLHKNRILNKLVFGGGTMLRLCYGLNRFSVDLDFWLIKDINPNKLFQTLKTFLEKTYTLTDAQNKFYTILFELKSSKYPRRLKIEIRKEKKLIKTERAIAYSQYADTQVLLTVVALDEMMKTKIQAFIDRREIRDVFDIEFLYKRGIALPQEKELLQQILKNIETLPKKDYTVKLGSIISADLRKYYTQENFKILKLAIKEKLS